MKKMQYVLPLLAILVMVSGCPGTGTNTVTDKIPVTDVTITNGADTLSAASILTFTVGDDPLVLDVAVTPADAVNVAGFKVQAESDDDTIAAVEMDSTSQKLTVTPGIDATMPISIAVSAQNKDNGKQPVMATFQVKVNPEGYIPAPVETVVVKNGETVLAAGAEVPAVIGSPDVVLGVSVTPADAAEKAGFSISPASDNTSKVKAAWDSSSDTITITPIAVTDTPVTITVYASNSENNGNPVTFAFKVSVTVDPNIIFIWSDAVNGIPLKSDGTAFVWNSGANNTTSKGVLKGAGKFTELPIFIGTMGANSAEITYDKGFLMDGTGTGNQSNKILVIGSNSDRVASGGSVSSVGGVFDFKDIPAGKGIKVTLNAEIVQGAVYSDSSSSQRSFRVSINNNTNTASQTPLHTTDNRDRILYFANPAQTNLMDSATNGSWDGHTFTCRIFRPEDFAGVADDSSLSDAYISFALTPPSGTIYNGIIRISGFKIEYVPFQSVDISVNPEADFSGFPDAIDLSKSDSQKASLTITLDKFTSYTGADWYLDGVKVSSAASYTLTAANLKTGDHSLSVVANIDGNVYSKSVNFTVAE